jgi:anti-sigma factor RsiW
MPRRPSCSCRQFRRLHAEYVDGFLSGGTFRACEMHVHECPTCASHDVLIRRSLLALQALPAIQPSAGFRDRLSRRIAREALEGKTPPPRRVRWGLAGGILAASVAMFIAASSRPRSDDDVHPASVMARAPEHLATTPAHENPMPTATMTSSPALRLEALPGRAPMRHPNTVLPATAVRLQAVNYLGQ